MEEQEILEKINECKEKIERMGSIMQELRKIVRPDVDSRYYLNIFSDSISKELKEKLDFLRIQLANLRGE